MNGQILRLLLTGPVVVTILVSFLSSTALIGTVLGRLMHLTALGRRATRRLSYGRGGVLLWGAAAGILTVIVAAILFSTKVLALLGLLVLLTGLTLAGLGLGVGAAHVGHTLASSLGHPDSPPLLALPLGIAAFFFTAFLPVVGWFLVVLAVLAGIGATLDTLIRRE